MPGSPTEPRRAKVAVSAADYLWFADLALDIMAAIVEELGDDRANRRPDLPGSQLALRHPDPLPRRHGVLGRGHGGRTHHRPGPRRRVHGDRPGRGARRTRRRGAPPTAARTWPDLDAADEPSHVRRNPDEPVPYTETKGAVLLHVLEELFQHFGQMELTRDILVAEPSSGRRRARSPAPSTPMAWPTSGREWRALVASSGVVGIEPGPDRCPPGPRRVRRRPGGSRRARSAREAVLRLLRRGHRARRPASPPLRLAVPDGAEEALATFVALLTP